MEAGILVAGVADFSFFDSFNLWVEIAVTTSYIVGSAILALLSSAWVRKYRVREKRCGRVSRRLREIPEIHAVLNDIGLSVRCSRVWLLVAENGSNIFPSYITIISEIRFNAKLEPRAKFFQRVAIDKAYKMKIGAAVNTPRDYEIVKTEELPTGLLKDIYRVDGVQQTIIAPILRSHCDDWAIYLSIGMPEDIEPNPLERVVLRDGGTRLRETIRSRLPE